jgi:hypothetical protein
MRPFAAIRTHADECETMQVELASRGTNAVGLEAEERLARASRRASNV